MWHIGGGGDNPPGKGYCAANATSPCGEQSFDKCGPQPSTCANVSGWTCHPAVCSGDASTARGDCGADISEPTLQCDSWSTCAPLAAAACTATPNCKSFGLSAAWGFGKAKLFTAGNGGLTPNVEWNVWTANAETRDTPAPVTESTYLDMYGRARHTGRWPVPRPVQRADASCELTLHSSPGPEGPWSPVSAVTINPCGGNNPAPWVHPNGTVYLVVTDNNMVRSITTFLGCVPAKHGCSCSVSAITMLLRTHSRRASTPLQPGEDPIRLSHRAPVGAVRTHRSSLTMQATFTACSTGRPLITPTLRLATRTQLTASLGTLRQNLQPTAQSHSMRHHWRLQLCMGSESGRTHTSMPPVQ